MGVGPSNFIRKKLVMASEISPEHFALPSVQRQKDGKWDLKSAVGVGNEWPQLQFRILDVLKTEVNETWLQPGERDNELVRQDNSFFRIECFV